MSNQPEQDQQQLEAVTPEEVREYLLAELEASQQVIAELSDEELVEIVGGAIGKVYQAPTINWTPKTSAAESSQAASAERANFLKKFNRSYSAPAMLQGHKLTPWEGPLPKRLQDYLDSFKGGK